MGFSIEAGVSVLTVFLQGAAQFFLALCPSSGAPVSELSLRRD